MSGAPGSGKSTVAKLLRSSIGGVVIDHDILRSFLLGSGLPFNEAAKHAYQLQWTLAQELIKQDLNVIIDSTCNFQEVLDQGSKRAKQYGYPYWYIECKVQDLDLLDQRLRIRIPMKSQRTGVDHPPAAATQSAYSEDSHALFRKWIEHPCRPEDNVIIVNSTQTPERLRDDILQQIVGQSS